MIYDLVGKVICNKCNVKMLPGIALEQTYGGHPDFIGGEVVTMSPSGPGVVVACYKCPGCGFSTTVRASASISSQ